MQRVERNTNESTRREWKEKESREFIPAGMSIERIAFFTPSSKRGIERLGTKVIDHEDLKVRLAISEEIGLPVTMDQDLYRAFQKVLLEHIESGRSLYEAIAVPTNKLLRYAGIAKRGGKERKGSVAAVRKWLDRMAGVLVKATYSSGKDRKPQTIRGTAFDMVLSPGEEFEDTGEIAETNYIWLGKWYREDIEVGNLRSVDLDFHRGLRKPVAKALYPLLETGWFASRGKVYRKSYNALCDLLLLGRYASLSRIRQQVDPSLEELKEAHFLEKWAYHPAKRPGGSVAVTKCHLDVSRALYARNSQFRERLEHFWPKKPISITSG
jgi:hypothetical protein